MSVIFGNLSLFSQNYHCINPNNISFFIDSTGEIRAFKIDSAAFLNNDSIYFTFKQIRPFNYKKNCYRADGASWLGKQLVLKSNGDYLFFNYQQDTIKIKSTAGLNENWIAFIYKNGSYIRATITKIDTSSFLGLNDSVKTIIFSAFDKNNIALSHRVNHLSISLSKNYGFVKTMNFLNFPDGLNWFIYSDQALAEYKLCGLTNPSVGCHNVTWKEVYNFNIGDELHTVYTSIEGHPYYDDRKNIYTIKTVISKSQSHDTLIYTFYRKEQTINQNINLSTHDTIRSSSTIKDTIIFRVAPNKYFDNLAGETSWRDKTFKYPLEYYQEYFANGRYLKFDPNLNNPLKLTDSCYGFFIADGVTADKYIEGLGGPYYRGGMTGFYELKLVYYAKF